MLGERINTILGATAKYDHGNKWESVPNHTGNYIGYVNGVTIGSTTGVYGPLVSFSDGLDEYGFQIMYDVFGRGHWMRFFVWHSSGSSWGDWYNI